MPYQWDQAYGNYVGYQEPEYGYGQPTRQMPATFANAHQQTMQRPAVAVPSQQNGDVSTQFGQAPPPHLVPTSPHLSSGYGQPTSSYRPHQTFHSPSLDYAQHFQGQYMQQPQHQQVSVPSNSVQGFYHTGTPPQMQGHFESARQRPASVELSQGFDVIQARQQPSPHMPSGYFQQSSSPVLRQSPHMIGQPFQPDLRPSSGPNPQHSAFDSGLSSTAPLHAPWPEQKQQRPMQKHQQTYQREPHSLTQQQQQQSWHQQQHSVPHQPIPRQPQTTQQHSQWPSQEQQTQQQHRQQQQRQEQQHQQQQQHQHQHQHQQRQQQQQCSTGPQPMPRQQKTAQRPPSASTQQQQAKPRTMGPQHHSRPQQPSRPRPPPQQQQQEQRQPPPHVMSRPSGSDPNNVFRQASQSQATSQRVLAHVEIPVQRADLASIEPETVHSIKRRRSNEGYPIAVCEPQKSTAFVTPPIPAPATQSLPMSQIPHTPQLDVDYQAVLLGLADEYINAAYRMVSPSMEDEHQDEYSSLLAMAIGCLQSSLVNYRDSDPRKEARIRLRLAGLLIDETTNAGDAGDILSKGIALCERNRLADLKYTMHYLLVLQQYQTSPKRAFKAAENLILEVEALQSLNWAYTFRLLRVTLSMQSGIHSDTAVLKHLSALASMAERNKHVAIQILVPVLESLVHLTSNAPDAVDLAQRAMSTARAHQLSPEMQRMPQLLVLLDCADVACALIKTQPGMLDQKMQQMQSRLDSEAKSKGWGKNGMLIVELGPTSNDDLTVDTCGLMRQNSGGSAALALQWLSKNHVYALGYMLSGLATASTKSHDKGLQFVQEGIKLVNAPVETFSQSMPSSLAATHQQGALALTMRLYIVFLHCGRYDYDAGHRQLQSLKQDIRSAEVVVDDATASMLVYQEALCKHGLGDLDGALDIYRSPPLAFGKASSSAALNDIRALAALNSVLILRARSSAESLAADDLLAAISTYLDGHANKSMHAAFFAVKATAEGSASAIVKTKQHLNSAIWASKEASNQQLLCIVMNIMVKMFFTNIVGAQAEKSTKAGRELAAKAGNKLWLAVADAMYADNAARSGRPDEAAKAELECRRAVKGLPPLVQQRLTGSDRAV